MTQASVSKAIVRIANELDGSAESGRPVRKRSSAGEAEPAPAPPRPKSGEQRAGELPGVCAVRYARLRCQRDGLVVATELNRASSRQC